MGSTRNSCRLLLDVGGTFLKSAVADAAGQLLSGSEFSCPIRSEGSREEIEGSLAATVARGAAFAAERGMELAGIGIAIPGPFDYAAGRLPHDAQVPQHLRCRSARACCTRCPAFPPMRRSVSCRT